MLKRNSRRRFLIGSASTGLVLSMNRLLTLTPVAQAASVQADSPPRRSADSVHIEYLAKGLSALARVHEVNAMAGHLGAAVVAGYLIGKQHPDLPPQVCRGIERELDRIIAGESVFSPKGNNALTVENLFESMPKQKSDERLVDGIADALTENIDRTRQSGHNVIFASIAIRAIKEHPEFSTPAVTDGIRKLIAGFNGQSAGSGYYGREKGRINGRKVTLPEVDDDSAYTDLQSMTLAVLDALISHAPERRVGYGGLTHLINHAAALAELANDGYQDLATQGLPAHYEHLRLWRTLPNVVDEPEQEAPERTEHDPRTAPFWQVAKLPTDHAKLTHRIKTLYGFDALTKRFKDPSKVREGNLSLRYLM